MLFRGHSDLIPLEFTPILVGGPGRSGTSLLHAALCSDTENNNVNEYVGEFTYLLEIIETFFPSHQAYDDITTAYFQNIDEFNLYHANLIRGILNDVWKELGKPKNLVLKSPGFASYFGLMSKLVPEAKFALSIRNPLDIVASMRNVNKKYENGENFNAQYIATICSQINIIYSRVIENFNILEGKLLPISYEQFVTGELDETINQFFGIKINLNNLWKSSKFKLEHGWLTDKYKNPREDSSIGNYATVLEPHEIEQVCRNCSGIMDAFFYKKPETTKLSSS